MMVELTAEVWVLKKRLYLLEKVAAEQGLDFTARIEAYAMEQAEVEELAGERKKMIANVLRALEAEFGAPADAPAETLEDAPPPGGAQANSQAA
jgi:hypothetical protein